MRPVADSRLGVIVACVLLVAQPVAAAAPPGNNLAWLKGLVTDGALLSYSYGDTKLHLTELSTGTSVQIATNVPNGWSFEFSPDSSKLAWIEGTTIKGRMRKGATTVHTIATGVYALAGVHWVSNTEVLYVKSAQWRRATIDGKTETTEPKLTALGVGGQETDVKLTGKGVWCYVARAASGTEVIWKTSDGKTGGTGGTCSASFSPEVNGGISVTGLVSGHKTAYLKAVIAGAPTGTISWIYDYDGDKGFDNHRWSSNHKDFVALQDEKYNYITVLQISTNEGTWIGPQGSGEIYGDFTVGSGSGAPWPGSGGSCGDGTLDQGETCDPPSSCPSSCDDKNACTTDTLGGSAAACTALCNHAAITACTGGDGCCPSGCDSTKDSDCSVSCGNGVVEQGETCDPKSSCLTSCDDKDACTEDLLTGSADNCNVACAHGAITACKGGDGCCPAGCGVTTDGDCASAPPPDGGSGGGDASAGTDAIVVGGDASAALDAGAGAGDASATNAMDPSVLEGGCAVRGGHPAGLAALLLVLGGLVLLARRRRRD